MNTSLTDYTFQKFGYYARRTLIFTEVLTGVKMDYDNPAFSVARYKFWPFVKMSDGPAEAALIFGEAYYLYCKALEEIALILGVKERFVERNNCYRYEVGYFGWGGSGSGGYEPSPPYHCCLINHEILTRVLQYIYKGVFGKYFDDYFLCFTKLQTDFYFLLVSRKSKRNDVIIDGEKITLFGNMVFNHYQFLPVLDAFMVGIVGENNLKG